MESDSAPTTVTVMRGDTKHVLNVPTPEQLNDAVIDAGMAVGSLRGIADALKGTPAEHVVPAIREIADSLYRFIAIVDPSDADPTP